MSKKGPGSSLLDTYNYNQTSSVRKALKNYFRLETKAASNIDALVILADMKTGMNMYDRGTKVLTDRQHECITLCLINDLTESEAATQLNITQQAVHYNVVAGVKRIRKYLLTGEVITSVFTQSEESKLIELYESGLKPLDIAEQIDKQPRTVRNKIKYLKKKGKLKRGLEDVDQIGTGDQSGSTPSQRAEEQKEE